MIHFKDKKYPLVKILTAAFIATALLQSVIIYLAAGLTGVKDKMDTSAISALNQTAAERCSYISDRMKSKWGAIDGNAENAEKILSDMIYKKQCDVSAFLSDSSMRSDYEQLVSQSLIDMLGSSEVSGAFVILCSDSAQPDSEKFMDYDGIFIKDSMPNAHYADYSDLMLLRGKSVISDKYKLPLDMNWKEFFSYNDKKDSERMDCFFSPTDAFYANDVGGDNSLLGYWSPMFSLSSSGVYGSDSIMTYSQPLVCRGQLFGVIGISVSEEQFKEYLPDGAFSDIGSDGFAIAYYNRNERAISDSFDMKASVISGTEVASSILSGNNISVKKSDAYSNIYSANHIKIRDRNAYCTTAELNLYSVSSPFYDTCWVLASFSGSDVLFGDSVSFSGRLVAAIFCSLVLNIALAFTAAALTSRPIKKLSESAQTLRSDGVIPNTPSFVEEIDGISDKLNSLSAERVQFMNDLRSERERYQIALHNTRSLIIEYDCVNDLFTAYHYSSVVQGEETGTKQRCYNHFRSMLENGDFCANEDISTVLTLADGITDRNIQLKLMMPVGNGKKELRWSDVYTKVIRNSLGAPVRIVASVIDINEQKIKEIEIADKERRDIVTGFYKSSYGMIAIEKAVLESEKPYCAVSVRLCGLKSLILSEGTYYTDAFLEEISVIICARRGKNDIACRVNSCEFALYMQNMTAEKGEAEIKELCAVINSIFTVGDTENRLRCRMGMEFSSGITEFKLSYARALQACLAANLPQYPDAVRYVERKTEADVKAASLTDDSDGKTEWNSDFVPTDNVISYSLNLLEKAGNFSQAVGMVLRKAGRSLDMSRIILYELDYDNCAADFVSAFNSPSTMPLNEKKHIFSREDFAMLSAVNDTDFVFTAGNEYYTPNEQRYTFVSFLRGNGTVYVCGISDKARAVGGIAFATNSGSADDEKISIIKELAKIISTYIVRSRTSLESRAKSEFLSRMSHEIRTPMNAIIGMTSIALKSEGLDRHTDECLHKIDLSAQYLLSLINDILDMSKIESGKMTVAYAPFNLDELVAQLDTIIRVQVEKNGIYFKVEKNIPAPMVVGDQLKLNQILVNILGNAVKFTSDGGITFTITQSVSTQSDIVSTRFSVKDTGIGISTENQKRIFNSFEQAEAETSKKYGGTGLGLSISSNLVRLLGGRLDVSSEVGKGSDFYFTLPFKTSSAEAVGAEISSDVVKIDFKGRRILLAEDNPLNLEIAKTLLEYEGMIVETAENGKLALDKFTSSPKGYYDAVLMDIRMPVMDGHTAAKEIRGSAHPDAKTIPVIAMTANAFDEDIRKSEECGMNGHITKPVDMNMVCAVLQKCWSKS